MAYLYPSAANISAKEMLLPKRLCIEEIYMNLITRFCQGNTLSICLTFPIFTAGNFYCSRIGESEMLFGADADARSFYAH